ncbi:hypothetical protein BJ875DRAFT_166465 [Amylocarpus encephaloides]|uniref:Uncharacterized protein n=1 Tax=Amylocarpus encephaloides TaxID=45428 RepID=A0A9P8C1A8_9HELO|nr:hypothetical protein BJ875DRAFT_166465 [Amylocarpus encephaloides]
MFSIFLICFVSFCYFVGTSAQDSTHFVDVIKLDPNDEVPLFQPVNIDASVGQVITFRFPSALPVSAPFTVTEGTFESPCVPKPGGFNSGPIKNFTDSKFGPIWYHFDFTIMNENPIYYFSEAIACTRGMAGGINTPANNASFYRQGAQELNTPATTPSMESPTIGPPSSTPVAMAPMTQATVIGTSSSDSNGSRVTIILIATPLGIAAILSTIFAVYIYFRRLRQARDNIELDQESGSSSKKDKKIMDLVVTQQPVELGMKSPSIFEMLGDIGIRHSRASRNSASKATVMSERGNVELEDVLRAWVESGKRPVSVSNKVEPSPR